MKSCDIADEIVSALKEFGRGSRQGHRPSAQEDFGVYTADLRSVVRAYKSRIKEFDGEKVISNRVAREVNKKLLTGKKN